VSLKAPKGYIEESDPRVAQFGHPAPAWLFPYADLMTELVCFFVILYALSAALNPDVQAAKEAVEQMMEQGEMAGDVTMDSEGLKISLQEQGEMSQFKSGYAEMTPRMESILDKLAPTLEKLAYKNHEILIEGHTDNVPIHNDYFWSNWELASSRATTVLEYLIDKKRFPAGCLGAIGYGAQRPIAENSTDAGRSKNRRVVFFVKNPVIKSIKCSELDSRGPRPPPGEASGEEGET